MNRKDFEEGLILGLVCPPLPKFLEAKEVPDEPIVPDEPKEPIAYSYNGVILPALPEWDRETYPYAVIFQYKTGGRIVFTATSIPITIGSAVCTGGASSDYTKLWAEINEDSAWDDLAENNNSIMGTASIKFLWSNYDVYNSSGTLKLAASEPVPVYE